MERQTHTWATVTKTFDVMTSILPLGSLSSVDSLLAATIYQGNHDIGTISLEYCVD
jgi:hypothetical protein